MKILSNKRYNELIEDLNFQKDYNLHQFTMRSQLNKEIKELKEIVHRKNALLLETFKGLDNLEKEVAEEQEESIRQEMILNTKYMLEFENKKEICVNCDREYLSDAKIVKSGILKGIKIINAFCGKDCRKIMEERIKKYSKRKRL